MFNDQGKINPHMVSMEGMSFQEKLKHAHTLATKLRSIIEETFVEPFKKDDNVSI